MQVCRTCFGKVQRGQIKDMEAAISSKKWHQATGLKQVPLAWETQGELGPRQDFNSKAAREKENHKNVSSRQTVIFFFFFSEEISETLQTALSK